MNFVLFLMQRCSSQDCLAVWEPLVRSANVPNEPHPTLCTSKVPFSTRTTSGISPSGTLCVGDFRQPVLQPGAYHVLKTKSQPR